MRRKTRQTSTLYCGAWRQPACRVTKADSVPHQHAYMRGGALRQGLQIIAAFERRDDAATAALLGNVQQLSGNPCEICRPQANLRQWIANVRIKSGRNQHDIG